MMAWLPHEPMEYKPVNEEPHAPPRWPWLGVDIANRLSEIDKWLTMRIRTWNQRSSRRVTRRHERMIRMVKAIAERILRSL